MPKMLETDMRALLVGGPHDGEWHKATGGTWSHTYFDPDQDMQSVYAYTGTDTDAHGDYAVFTHKVMVQEAPWPTELERMVEELRHRPNYHAHLSTGDFYRGQGCKGLTLVVQITEPDAYHPERPRTVNHYFPVPAAAYDYRSWRRWLFNQLNSISLHEDMEHFTISGEKPFAPSHGPGNDPYMVREVGTELDQRTSFRGEVNPA